MTIAMEDLRGALTCLAERFPQTFVLEGYQPHRPLKVGIAADLMSRCPELDRRKLSAALSAYTQRVMYLEGMVAGTARIDLDGNLAGEVSALDAEHAAERLAKILASRQATRATAVAARSAERVARQAVPATATPPAATPPAAKILKDKPVLRLPAFRVVAALNRTGPAPD
jgi:sRNA-binding protein